MKFGLFVHLLVQFVLIVRSHPTVTISPNITTTPLPSLPVLVPTEGSPRIETTTYILKTAGFNYCTEEQYMCKGGRACVHRSFLCDGVKDCPQGDDETACNSQRKCQRGWYQCEDSLDCIPLSLVCNGLPDCVKGDDEIETSCAKNKTSESQNIAQDTLPIPFTSFDEVFRSTPKPSHHNPSELPSISQKNRSFPRTQGVLPYTKSQAGRSFPKSQGVPPYTRSKTGRSFPKSQGVPPYTRSKNGRSFPKSQGVPPYTKSKTDRSFPRSQRNRSYLAGYSGQPLSDGQKRQSPTGSQKGQPGQNPNVHVTKKTPQSDKIVNNYSHQGSGIFFINFGLVLKGNNNVVGNGNDNGNGNNNGNNNGNFNGVRMQPGQQFAPGRGQKPQKQA